MLGHVRDNPETALGVLEVPVLDAGLNDIEGRGDDEGCAGTGDRSDEVLPPGSGVVVGELVEIFLGRGRTTKEL